MNIKNKNLYGKKKDLNDVIKLGFATFFLNRTNFSGILNAGPIGGLEQKGKYKINARFNKEGLIKKIKTIATYKDRFTILNKDAIEVIKMYNMPEYFMYIDPPYYTKGKELYMNYYKDKDHKKLERIVKTSNAKWFLSYDKCNFIEKLYEKYTKKTVDLKYSLSSNKSNKDAKELLINKNILGD